MFDAEPHHDREPIDETLLRLRLRDSRHCQSLLGEPWGLSVPASDALSYVFVAQGSCLVRAQGQADVTLQAGQMLVIPRGAAHQLLSAADVPAVDPSALSWDSALGRCIIRGGHDGPQTHLLTGVLELEVNLLVESLPSFIGMRRRTDRWLSRIAEALRDEALRPGPGSEVVMSRLAELLIIGVIRDWLRHAATDGPGLLAALADPPIRRVLNLMHADPRRPWTMAQLARTAGLSRTVFAERFRSATGTSPMRYWTAWRMNVAAQWLRARTHSVDEAATELGYSSRAAFARAFKATLGVPPGRTQREPMRRLVTLNDRLSPHAERRDPR